MENTKTDNSLTGYRKSGQEQQKSDGVRGALILAGIMFFFIVMRFAVKSDEKLLIPSETLTNTAHLDEILSGDIYEQEFYGEYDCLQQIKLFMATFARSNRSHLLITLMDADHSEIRKWDVDCQKLKDNSYYTIDLGSAARESRGKKFFLSISSDAEAGQGVTIFYNDEEGSTGLTRNGKSMKASLCIQQVYRDEFRSLFRGKNGIHLLLLAFLIAAGMAIALIDGRQMKTEWLFLILWICLTLMYLDAGTLFRVPDEEGHFFRAFEVSEGHPVSEFQPDFSAGGRELPFTGVDLKLLETNWDSFSENKNMTLSKDRAFITFSNLALYAPVSYIPQAAGIFAARHLHLGVAGIAYAGRLANWLCITLLLFFAVRLIPSGKEIILLISMMPMNLFEAFSLSPDGMVVAVSIFMLSFVLYLRHVKKGRITWIEMLLLFGSAVLIGLYKIVYLPFCLTCFLVPEERFGKRSRKIAFLLVTILTAAGLNLGWLMICRRFLVTLGTDAARQLGYIFAHPFYYLVTIMRTFFQAAGWWTSTMVGSSLGELNIITVEIFVFLYFVLLGIRFYPHKDRSVRPERGTAWVMGMVLFSIMILTFTSLYLQWTPAYQFTIEGIQGRYFISLLLPLYFVLNGVEVQKSGSPTRAARGFIVCINACAAIDLLFSCMA